MGLRPARPRWTWRVVRWGLACLLARRWRLLRLLARPGSLRLAAISLRLLARPARLWLRLCALAGRVAFRLLRWFIWGAWRALRPAA